MEVRTISAKTLQIVHTEELISGDKCHGSRFFDDVRRLLRRQARIDRYKDAPGRQNPEGRNDPRGRIGRPQRHGLSGPKTPRHQGGSEVSHPVRHLGERITMLQLCDCGTITEALGARQGHPGDRSVSLITMHGVAAES